MNAITIKGKKLVLNYDSFDFVEFEDEIKAVLDYDNVVVVITVPERGYVKPENVYGVKDNQLIWQIQEVEDYLGLTEPNYFSHSPYSSIRPYKNEPQIFIATNGGGYRYLIDPYTGKIIRPMNWDE